jgi:hypothetical protein
MQWIAPPPLEMMPGVAGAIISTLPPLELRTGGIATLGNLQGWTLLLCCLAAGRTAAFIYGKVCAFGVVVEDEFGGDVL